MTQNSVNSGATHIYNVSVVSSGRIAASNTVMQGMTGAAAALTWAEGMSTGNISYLTEWSAVAGSADVFTSLTTTNGTTTASRAATNGTVTGTLVESAYFFDSYSLDATDMLNFIITADGDVTMRDSLFASANAASFTRFSAGLAQQDGCTMATGAPSGTPTACPTALIVTLAAAYTNGSGVAACQPTLAFGGGICDPDTFAASVFE